MFKKDNLNLLIKIGYGISILIGCLLSILLFLTLFLDSFRFNYKLIYTIFPVILYLVYLRFIVQEYYNNLVEKEISSWQEIPLKIDKLITTTVQKRFFTYYGMGSHLYEYYFTFFNEEFSTHITISSIGHKPDYDIISNWKSKMITVFTNIEKNKKDYHFDKKKKISSIRVFRFEKMQFNLENTYHRSLHEFIAEKRKFEGLLIIFIPLFITFFLIYLLIKL